MALKNTGEERLSEKRNNICILAHLRVSGLILLLRLQIRVWDSLGQPGGQELLRLSWPGFFCIFIFIS